MEAVRCVSCGETRWSLFGNAKPGEPCRSCGGQTVPERRRPGAGVRRTTVVERRDREKVAGG